MLTADQIRSTFEAIKAAAFSAEDYDAEAALRVLRSTQPGLGLLYHSGGGFVHALGVAETEIGPVLFWTSPYGCGVCRTETLDAVDAFFAGPNNEEPCAQLHEFDAT